MARKGKFDKSCYIPRHGMSLILKRGLFDQDLEAEYQGMKEEFKNRKKQCKKRK